MFDDYDTYGFGEQIDRASSIAELLTVVAAINTVANPEGITSGGLGKLREWLEKLAAKLKELGENAGAATVTLTVGTHVTASVSYAVMPGGSG
jgi:hypothetical protein